MRIEKKNISDLLPAGYNPRKDLQPGDAEYEKLKRSIQEFDYIDPVIWNQQTRTVVGGHQRLKVLQDLGHTKVEVSVVDLPLGKEMALNVALNKVSGDWDTSKLSDLMLDLQDMDIDMELTGFDMDEINDLLPEKIEDGLCDEDQVPDVPEEPVTKLGDIYKLGNHRLMCGDSTSIDAVEKLMDGEKAHMSFTDPPYNIDYGNIKHPKFKQRSIENDNMSASDFNQFCHDFITCIKMTVMGCVYIAGPPGPDGRIMFTNADNILNCSTTVIWNKDQFTLGRGKYQNKYEPIWFGWVENGTRFSKDRKLVNVWDIPRPKKSELHPTMKPVELVVKAVEDASMQTDIVLDLFGGSGTTCIACEKTGRKARLMELDPKYCDVIVKRWEDYTGKKAELLNG